MKTYTLEDAHKELCSFLDVKSLKDKPELILDYYRTVSLSRAAESLSDILRGLNLRSVIHGRSAAE